MPKLSLCYIVKNEIETLPESVRHMQGLYDELVVVDTGSSDGTDAWAHTVADIYSEIIWDNDFAMARNHALELATGNWVLMLDADEWIDERFFGYLRESIGVDVDGYQLPVFNFLQSPFWVKKPIIFYGKALRLFKNYDNVAYTGKIHEQLQGIDRVTDSKAAIYHFKYKEERRIKKKSKLYLKLMEEKIRSEGRTFLNVVHLADVYRSRYIWLHDKKDLRKLVSLLDEALKIKDDLAIANIRDHYKKELRSAG